MIKIIAIIGAGLAVAVAAIFAYATTRPDSFSVQRATTIKAPPEKVFAQLGDFHAWSAWSPWEKMDPQMRRTFSGAASGKGAVYAWEGNKKVGKGRMEITEASPAKIAIKLDFIEPFEGHNVTEFTLEPKGDSTTLTWTMSGPANFMTKLMQVFVSMDAMVGKDFEAGLAGLKAIAEK